MDIQITQGKSWSNGERIFAWSLMAEAVAILDVIPSREAIFAEFE
jgi:hypothetical protein